MAKIINYLRNRFTSDVIDICYILAHLLLFVNMIVALIAVIFVTIKLLSHG
jgi:hypothetical protein